LDKEFNQIEWDKQLRESWLQILRLAAQEDLADTGDWTTRALVPDEAISKASIKSRSKGVISGLVAIEDTLEFFDPRLSWTPESEDCQSVQTGQCIGFIEGPTQSLLTAERTVLNMLGHLSGIATLTRQYVELVYQTKAKIYDTRKTTPGWRRLEKYAVRCGGGQNHRTGLFEAVLIKDNHLAHGEHTAVDKRFTPAEAVTFARKYVETHVPSKSRKSMLIEVEIDRLDQLDEVLLAAPDIILLDNMCPAELREAVSRRDACNRSIDLEASGSVNLKTVAAIAETGVDRISVGALTHSASCLDLGLDWHSS